jgi:hypothetical protein
VKLLDILQESYATEAKNAAKRDAKEGHTNNRPKNNQLLGAAYDKAHKTETKKLQKAAEKENRKTKTKAA